MHHHHHGGHCGSEAPCGTDPDDSPSTGFLPMSLAVVLFVAGLFMLGWVQCDPGFSVGLDDDPSRIGDRNLDY